MNKNDLLQRLQEIDVIFRGKVLLRSGESADFYCDIKKAFGYPDILNALADHIVNLIPDSAHCVASSGYGGLPLAAVVAARSHRKFIAIRPQGKDYGRGETISGYIPQANDKVVIIDDVLTSGSSLRDTLEVLGKNQCEVVKAIVVVKRGDPQLPIQYSYLFTIDEILSRE